jgi:pyruvate formate lyase activating enzyme
MKRAILFEKLTNNRVRCNVCSHRCLISNGQRGICQTRENRDGVLYSLVYGQAIAENIDPIEKKPLFHFLPGTQTLTIATIGCNFRCGHCQNWQISQASKTDHTKIPGEKLLPKEIVAHATSFGCPSISYSYTEPTIFLEYALDTMKLANERHLRNIWVTNGYMTSETLKLITPYLDAANVDLKSFSEKFYTQNCGARLQPILNNLKQIAKSKIHLEVTTLIIPGENDSKEELNKIAKFIASKLGKETPWHISRFFPQYKMADHEITPIKSLELAESLGKKAGLKYIHLGNV